MMANLLGRSIIRSASMKAGPTSGAGSFIAHEDLRDAQAEMIGDGIAALGAGGFLLAAAPNPVNTLVNAIDTTSLILSLIHI